MSQLEAENQSLRRLLQINEDIHSTDITDAIMDKLRNTEQSSEFRLQDNGVNNDIQNKIAEAGEYIRK